MHYSILRVYGSLHLELSGLTWQTPIQSIGQRYVPLHRHLSRLHFSRAERRVTTTRACALSLTTRHHRKGHTVSRPKKGQKKAIFRVFSKNPKKGQKRPKKAIFGHSVKSGFFKTRFFDPLKPGDRKKGILFCT